MPIIKTLITLLLFLTASTFSVFCFAQDKKKSRTRPVLPYNHATLNAPPNMVYIRGGSTTIKYNQTSIDSNSAKKVSLTSFFIDKTEITNQQYRQFVEWVVDSIAIVKYLKDDKYFLPDAKGNTKPGDQDNQGATSVDTAKSNDSTAKSTEPTKTSFASDSANKANDSFNAKRKIDWTRVNHKKIFGSKDEDIQNKIKPLLDENGDIRKDAYQFSYTYLKQMNTNNAKAKTRQFVTETISVYPDEKVWAEDLTNSQTELLVENYFKITPYEDYPLVGVTWKQARAFCYWRSLTATEYTNMPEFMKYYHLTYSLPSEAQWVYAASGFYDMIASNPDTDTTISNADTLVTKVDSTVTAHDSAYTAAAVEAAQAKIAKDKADKEAAKNADALAEASRNKGEVIRDSTPIHHDENGLLSNFKQEEGDYWEDGSALTLPVMSFAPNEFGLYNMEGNVSEWMLDAYSPSTFSFVSDLNPSLQYDADSLDADAMRRKVIRGGSFMSNAKALSPYYRDLELDNVAHCYLGFRCVLMAPEVLYRPVATRKKKLVGNSTNKINQRVMRK